MEDMEDIVPSSKPPTVPEDGTYITALNEAGVDPERIEQLKQSKFKTSIEINLSFSFV